MSCRRVLDLLADSQRHVYAGNRKVRPPPSPPCGIERVALSYAIYPFGDAVGGTSVEAHRAALERMIQAGARPTSWVQVLCELQRDWSRKATAGPFGEILFAVGVRDEVCPRASWPAPRSRTGPQDLAFRSGENVSDGDAPKALHQEAFGLGHRLRARRVFAFSARIVSSRASRSTSRHWSDRILARPAACLQHGDEDSPTTRTCRLEEVALRVLRRQPHLSRRLGIESDYALRFHLERRRPQ
jgi:hypothetical protein